MALTAGNDNQLNQLSVGLPDWLPDIERLRRDADRAREQQQPDPWLLVEVECWQDLLEAEIAAQKRLASGTDVMEALQALKANLGSIARDLQRLNSPQNRLRAHSRHQAAA